MVFFFDARRKPRFSYKSSWNEKVTEKIKGGTNKTSDSHKCLCVAFSHMKNFLFDQKAVTPRKETCFWFSRSNSS